VPPDDGSLGLFVRSLVVLDREAAKRALGKFISGGNLSANQIELVNLKAAPPPTLKAVIHSTFLLFCQILCYIFLTE
jgi:hypothetical protein